jgi:tetratricopeptide (TPR) repeat protein
MKPIALLLAAATMIAIPARAQTPASTPAAGATIVRLTNGTEISSDRVRRNGSNIAVTVVVTAGRTETQYPASAVARIDFPQPAGIARAEAALASKDAKTALAAITPVISQQAAFRDIPGNWWARAVAVQVKALAEAGRYDDAERELEALAKTASPEELRPARLEVAKGWAVQGKLSKALPIFDEVIAQSKDKGVVARAWISKGDASLAAKDYDAALLSYLRIPIFYSDDKALMPVALLGAGRAFARVEEPGKARESFEKVVSDYPNSTSAAAAKKELDKLGGNAS